MILLLVLLLYASLAFTCAIWYWAYRFPIDSLRDSIQYNRMYTDPLRRAGLGESNILYASELPIWIPLAILLTEDPGFFSHRGFAYSEMYRRLSSFLFRKGGRASGSTISQQLIKAFFTFSEPTPLRKLKEAILTIRLEKHFSKQQILALYLSNATFAQDIFGVQEACQRYFKKPASECSINEAALLAILLRRPRTLGIKYQSGLFPTALHQELYDKIQHIHIILLLYGNLSYPIQAKSSSTLDVESLLESYHAFFPGRSFSHLARREITDRSLDSFADFITAHVSQNTCTGVNRI